MEEKKCLKNNNYEQCNDCHKLFFDDVLEYLDGLDMKICSKCLSIDYDCCIQCHKWVFIEDAYEDDDFNPLCKDCFDAYYFHCSECKRVLHLDHCANTDADEYICTDCASDC